MLVREATPDDLEDVLRLYRQLHPKDPAVQDGSDASVFARILSTPGLYLFVLEVDELVAATTYLNVIPNLTRSVSPYAVIENVVVDQARRGTGLGKQYVWEVGCQRLTGARLQVDLVGEHEQDRSEPVPFRLVAAAASAVGGGGDAVDGRGGHRRDGRLQHHVLLAGGAVLTCRLN